MSVDRKAVRFAAPLERGGWVLRAVAGTTLTAGCLPLAAGAVSNGSGASASVALVAALAFALAAVTATRRALARRPPLVIDERGVRIDDGPRARRDVRWSEVARVRLVDGLFRRRVVLDVAGDAAPLVIPSFCHGGLPPEWLAGLIETFRECGGQLDRLKPAP